MGDHTNKNKELEKNEGLFDKFIKDIVSREESHRKKIEELAADQATLPQRQYNKLYREKPQNRIVYRKVKK
tara:strand:+ start:256 stop:468 length:213 start_codon:yes stop_codon:yes gene_type:complete